MQATTNLGCLGRFFPPRVFLFGADVCLLGSCTRRANLSVKEDLSEGGVHRPEFYAIFVL